MNNFSRLKKYAKFYNLVVEVITDGKTKNHCKIATKNRYKRTDNTDLF